MTRYFLHLQYPDEVVRDPDGAMYSGLEAAKAEAELDILALASECLATGRTFILCAVTICDEQGHVQAQVMTSRALARLLPN